MFSQITIVGAGRIGTLFSQLSQNPSVEVSLLRRGEQTPLPTGPIVVCTRNDDLDGVLGWIPPERHRDLVFIQNGVLHTWFEQKGLQNVTQGLLYIAVSSVGAEVVDGGRSVVTGPHAESILWLMNTLNLQCTVISKEQFLAEMLEKVLWNCVFGLLCDVHNCTVGELVTGHRSDVSTLTDELRAVALPVLNISTEQLPLDPLLERLCEYSLSISEYRGALKEWKWRNGWFWLQSPDPDCVHASFLRKVNPDLVSV